MSILETFEVLPSVVDNGDIHPLHVTEGQFKGIKFKFGRVWFPDENPDTLSFEYDLLEGSAPVPEGATEEFSKYMGDIIIAMLRKQLGIAEESNAD